MNDFYFFYYTFNNLAEKREILVNKDLSLDFQELLEQLPKFEPSEDVLKKLFQLI